MHLFEKKTLLFQMKAIHHHTEEEREKLPGTEETVLTLKASITTAADDIHKYFFHCFSEKIRLDVSSASSARQRIHTKTQALFSSKYKSKQLKCRLLQFLFGALRVKHIFHC